jgi:hypothetical protein
MQDNDKPLTNAEKDKQFDQWAEQFKVRSSFDQFIKAMMDRAKESN